MYYAKIGLHINNNLLVIFNVNNGRLELPRRNTTIEQDVTLAIGAMLELREKEEGCYPADTSSTPPYVSALSCKIPTCWVEQLRSQIDHWNLRDVVSSSANTSA